MTKSTEKHNIYSNNARRGESLSPYGLFVLLGFHLKPTEPDGWNNYASFFLFVFQEVNKSKADLTEREEKREPGSTR